MFDIHPDDLSAPATRALIALHLGAMSEASPPGTSFALDLSSLQSPDITFWSVWRDGDIVGMGALKMLADGTGEIKSMRTHPAHLRQGVAGRLLDHIIAQARARGLTRLSLETGTGPAFEPALALYRGRGFATGPCFADYPEGSAFNQYLHLSL
jgi:putative acetyltransferase